MRNVLIGCHAEQLSAFLDVFSLYRGGKRLLLHFLFHAARRHAIQLLGPHVSHRGDKSTELIHSEQGFSKRPVERELVPIPIGVGKNGGDDFFIDAPSAQDLCTLSGMVWRIWPPFVIEIMKNSGESPLFSILAKMGRVMAHRSLDRQGMVNQRL